MNNRSTCRLCGLTIYQRKNGDWGSEMSNPTYCRRKREGLGFHQVDTRKESLFDNLYKRMTAHQSK